MISKVKFLGKILVIIVGGYLIGHFIVTDHIQKTDGLRMVNDKGIKEEAPSITLKSLSGKLVSLSDFKGKWVFLNFWATWCAPCVVEMPMMNNLYNKLKDKNFIMLGISLDKENPYKVAKFAKNLKLDFPILLDPKLETATKYGVTTIPLTFMIGPDGRLEAIAEGIRNWDSKEMIQYFNSLINEEFSKTVN
jgi:peroxiredoxin